MSFFTRKPEETPEAGDPFVIDAPTLVCPTCERELMAWETTCPTDGTDGVRRDLRHADIPAPPAHLLGDEAEDAPGDA